jgi:non-heme chloroperoxidase
MPYYITKDHVRLYYEEKGQGKPVILIHGLNASRIHFNKQIPKLAEEFRVIVYDLRGHGDSERPEHGLTLPRFGKDLAELMDYLDLSGVSMVGWSMGAQVMFEYIKQYTCRRLDKICIIDMTPRLLKTEGWEYGLRGAASGRFGDFTRADTLLTLSGMCEDWDLFVRQGVEKLFDKRLLNEKKEFDYKAEFKGKEDLEWLYKEAERNTPHVIICMWIALVMQDYRFLLPKISVPSLITYGEESNYYAPANSQYLKSMIPDSRLVGFPGCGHAPQLQDPEAFNREIMTFLRP